MPVMIIVRYLLPGLLWFISICTGGMLVFWKLFLN